MLNVTTQIYWYELDSPVFIVGLEILSTGYPSDSKGIKQGIELRDARSYYTNLLA